MCSLRGS